MTDPADPGPVSLSDRIVARRRITGMSAVLLPFTDGGDVDWAGFEGLLERTVTAGLVPAVNMDTGFGPLIGPDVRSAVLGTAAHMTERCAGPDRFVAGAIVEDSPGAAHDHAPLAAAMAEVADRGGTPIVFPSHGLAALSEDELVAAMAAAGGEVDRFLGFELGEMFHPAGRIWSDASFAAILEVPSLAGVKHSSLRRGPELARLDMRDRLRPDVMVLTGNDLAIDMVCYGSDYLLGLSAFAPDAFGLRDAAWEAGDELCFAELNDVLQELGRLAFRAPVPAYRHDAALFLQRRGWIASSRTHPRSPTRPEWELDLLDDLAERLAALLT